jgi:FkbM family methyltransferase
MDSIAKRCIPASYRKRLARTALFQRAARHLGWDERHRAAALRQDPLLYEPMVGAAIRRIVKPGWTSVDIGANVGMISGLLAELVGAGGRVIAFEAFPDNARVLRERMEQLGFANRVVVENIAVTDGSAPKVWLHAGRDRSLAEWNIIGHDLDGNSTPAEIEVRAASLDQYFNAQAPVHFVKMDIEGAGKLALPGMRRVIHEHRPAMLIEFHDEPEWAARRYLLEEGYGFFELDGRRFDASEGAERRYQCLAIFVGV